MNNENLKTWAMIWKDLFRLRKPWKIRHELVFRNRTKQKRFGPEGIIYQKLENNKKQGQDTENSGMMYLLVKSIPAQKLPIHRRITHFWVRTLLGGTSPLLFKFIALYTFQKQPSNLLHSARKNHVQNLASGTKLKKLRSNEGCRKGSKFESGHLWKKKILGGQSREVETGEESEQRAALFFLFFGLFLSWS